MMNIQKEHEEFKEIAQQLGYQTEEVETPIGIAFKHKSTFDAFRVYQAAKAVPKGFVLMPKVITEEMLSAAWEAPPITTGSLSRRTFNERQTVVYNAIVLAAQKEMTKVQEQSHVN